MLASSEEEMELEINNFKGNIPGDSSSNFIKNRRGPAISSEISEVDRSSPRKE